jgi:hypothetical protein
MRFPQTKWLEMLGLVPASLFLAPLIAAGAAGTFLAMVTWLFQDTPPLRVRLAIIGGISVLLLLMLSALLGLAAAWLTLVFRPEIVRGKAIAMMDQPNLPYPGDLCRRVLAAPDGNSSSLHQQVCHHGLATLDAITRAADSRGSATVVFTL